MKFREGFYLTDTYGPRLQRMMAEGSASGPLADAFWRVFEGGSRRMLESEAEAEQLFRETRDQLLIVLRQLALPRARWRAAWSRTRRVPSRCSACRSRGCSPTSTARRAAATRLAVEGLIENRPLRRGRRGARAARARWRRARATARCRSRAAWRATTRATISPPVDSLARWRSGESSSPGALAAERFARVGCAGPERRAVGPEAGQAAPIALATELTSPRRELSGAGRARRTTARLASRQRRCTRARPAGRSTTHRSPTD